MGAPIVPDDGGWLIAYGDDTGLFRLTVTLIKCQPAPTLKLSVKR
jgi:hypothetical protein